MTWTLRCVLRSMLTGSTGKSGTHMFLVSDEREEGEETGEGRREKKRETRGIKYRYVYEHQLGEAN